MKKWTRIGGDLVAKFDGRRYVDIARRPKRGSEPMSVVFLSEAALVNALRLLPMSSKQRDRGAPDISGEMMLNGEMLPPRPTKKKRSQRT